MNKKIKKTEWNKAPLIAVFIIILLLVFNKGKFFGITLPGSSELITKQSNDNLVSEPFSGKIVLTGYHPDYDYGTNQAGGQIAERQYFLSDDEQQRIPVPDEIWFKLMQVNSSHKSGKKGSRQIFEFVLPVNPENKDIIFISTFELSPDRENYSINRIFSYNLKTFDLIEIYQEEVLGTGLYTVGVEGSKVLFVREDASSSPPSCIGLWSPYKSRKHEYLELADIKGGLKPYTVPQYRLDQDNIEYNKCIKDLGY